MFVQSILLMYKKKLYVFRRFLLNLGQQQIKQVFNA